MRCRAATLAATVEGPRFPFSMASERKKQKQEERAKAGKKPVMLNLKKRKDSETSPVKARPVTTKQLAG